MEKNYSRTNASHQHLVGRKLIIFAEYHTMKYGVCHLGIVPVRFEKDDRSEIVTQLLYGDTYTLLEVQKKWSKIRIDADRYQGWIANNQTFEITTKNWKTLTASNDVFTTDLASYCSTENNVLFPIPLGRQPKGTRLIETPP